MANSSNYQIVKQDIVGFYLATPPIYVNEKFPVLLSRFDTEFPPLSENTVCLNKHSVTAAIFRRWILGVEVR